jgi:BNR/Asp-box repeat protein
MRAYASTDGGKTWRTTTAYPKPRSLRAVCAADPAVAIDSRGRQYYAFIYSKPCGTGRPRLYVVTRAGPDGRWSTLRAVAPIGGGISFDDKPAMTVDGQGRVYLVWIRASKIGVFSVALIRSDDGGRTWSRPTKVNRTGRQLTYPSVAVSRTGTVYVVWDDAGEFAIRIARSTDAGKHFGPEKKVAAFSIVTIPHCGSGIVIPAQRFTCAHANPIVVVDASTGRYSGRVYVSYAKTAFYGNQGTHVAAFDAKLRVVHGDREHGEGLPVTPGRQGKARSDQFWPQSAVDPSNGTAWVCFYDTLGDPQRTRAFYTCTASTNGGKSWRRPVQAASVASDETKGGAASYEYGDYEGLVAANGVAHPIWTDSRHLKRLEEEIYTARLTLDDLP